MALRVRRLRRLGHLLGRVGGDGDLPARRRRARRGARRARRRPRAHPGAPGEAGREPGSGPSGPRPRGRREGCRDEWRFAFGSFFVGRGTRRALARDRVFHARARASVRALLQQLGFLRPVSVAPFVLHAGAGRDPHQRVAVHAAAAAREHRRSVARRAAGG